MARSDYHPNTNDGTEVQCLCLEIQNQTAEAVVDHIAVADADLTPVPCESE